jgi:hypothetical protein
MLQLLKILLKELQLCTDLYHLSTACRARFYRILHFILCHSKNAIDAAPQDVIKTTRWNIIGDAFAMHKM